jgi:hypothetical protein
MKSPKIKHKPADPGWYEHWWRKSPVAEVNDKGKTKAKPDAEFWFDNYWKPRELAIWIYELVRRLPQIETNRSRKPESKIAKADINILLALPPYPRLSPEQKAGLVSIITRKLDAKLINEECSALDNTSSRKQLPDWRRGQPHKLANWRQVEALDKKDRALSAEVQDKERALILKQQRWDKRREAREHARRYLPLVLPFWKFMLNASGENALIIPLLRSPKQHALSEAIITDAEFLRALQKVKKRN